MSDDDELRRRRFLQAAGTAGVSSVVGCAANYNPEEIPTVSRKQVDGAAQVPTDKQAAAVAAAVEVAHVQATSLPIEAPDSIAVVSITGSNADRGIYWYDNSQSREVTAGDLDRLGGEGHLLNFSHGDQFNGYPLEVGDVAALSQFAVGDQFADYPLHAADVQATQAWSQGDQFGGYPLVDADYRRKASVDSANTTTFTTADENTIRVDPSSAAVTVTLASADAVDGNRVTIWDAGRASSTNGITVETEGSETFADGTSSKTISHDGAWLTVEWDSTLSVWVTARSPQFEALDANSISTEEADITNETFIRVTRSSNSGSTNSSTWANAYDGESKDVRSEYNSSAQFVPDETGEYEITANVDIDATSGDRIRLRIRDITNGSTVGPQPEVTLAASRSFVSLPLVVNLTGGVTHEVQVTDLDSSFNVIASNNCVGTIVRSVVG